MSDELVAQDEKDVDPNVGKGDEATHEDFAAAELAEGGMVTADQHEMKSDEVMPGVKAEEVVTGVDPSALVGPDDPRNPRGVEEGDNPESPGTPPYQSFQQIDRIERGVGDDPSGDAGQNVDEPEVGVDVGVETAVGSVSTHVLTPDNPSTAGDGRLGESPEEIAAAVLPPEDSNEPETGEATGEDTTEVVPSEALPQAYCQTHDKVMTKSPLGVRVRCARYGTGRYPR